ncbi:restriction endonuclease [Photobacterium phosphoreum]|uniref:restriction endonuclease n=1 Tax=Photobacterium phosphoreum TaxID=659 RepID=UPI001E510F35|nr:restriction endonuclease [Photobacterium phosphoreum]MCD9469545.1 hypothetical protein [Photobacterium phosphoreum]
MSFNVKDVVPDWGGFEEFVKEIHEGHDVVVERDVTLIGQSGAPRQIDVHVTHTKGPYEYSTLIECKHWKNKVKRQQIENMYASMDDLNASKGVIFTTSGFQSGAETYSKAKNIDIYVIRDLKPEEWGMPGRDIEFYVQIFSKSIVSIDCHDTMIAKPEGVDTHYNNELSLCFGAKDHVLHDIKSIEPKTGQLQTISVPNNQIVSSHKKKGFTLEEYLESAATHGQSSVTNNAFLINNGEECTRYLSVTVNMPFKEKGELLKVISKGQLIYIPKITMEVGIKVHQFKFRHDRGSNLLYALAVEDCIGNNSFSISKEKNKSEVHWQKISKESNTTTSLVNGSILKVTTNGFFDASEMNGLKEVDLNIDSRESKCT